MKRSALRRSSKRLKSTPLRRYTSLRRSASPPQVATGVEEPAGGMSLRSSRPRAGGHRIERSSATIVRERSGGVCEIQLDDGCWGQATEKSHRIARGMGGRHGLAKKLSDRPSDLLDSCLYCHLLITTKAWIVDAKANGWVLLTRQEPTAVPVLYRGELAYLDDAGGVHSYEEAGT